MPLYVTGKKMRRLSILSAIVVLTVILLAWPSAENVEHSPPGYAGSRRCKVCHYEIYESWSKTKHARAFDALSEQDASRPECLRCHTTGYRKGGFGSDGNLVDLRGVQCEACHGAGLRYSRASVMRQPALSRELGLTDVDSLTCVRCHNQQSPAFKGFAYKAGLQTGTHSQKRVTATTP